MTGRYQDCPKCKAVCVDLTKHRCPPQFECCWEWSIESPDDPDAEWQCVFAVDESVAAELYAQRHDDENSVVENGVIVWVRRPGTTEHDTYLVSVRVNIEYFASAVDESD